MSTAGGVGNGSAGAVARRGGHCPQHHRAMGAAASHGLRGLTAGSRGQRGCNGKDRDHQASNEFDKTPHPNLPSSLRRSSMVSDNNHTSMDI